MRIPLLLLLLPLTTAHVKLLTPTPYGHTHLTTNPLLTAGADYPCKLRPSAFSPSNTTTIPHLTPQPLTFIGQATHGGGSCQVSLSRDIPPNLSPASVFKVIESIEGGCPSANVGNVGTDAEGTGADKFVFEVPEGVGTGEFTLAWTWFNRVGEREMYMNCAPVMVVPNAAKSVGKRGRGGGRRSVGDESGFFESLPDMFRANIGNGCNSAESGTTLKFPEGNLGNVVQRIGNEELVPPVGDCGVGGGVVKGGTSVEMAAAMQKLAVSSSISVSTPVVAASPPPANQVPVVASSPSPPYEPPAPATPQQPPAPASYLPTSPCPSVGKSVCVPDGKSWGTCMADHTVIFQPVARGTRCDLALGVEVVV